MFEANAGPAPAVGVATTIAYALIVTPAIGTERRQDLRRELVGSWRLVSFEVRNANGSTVAYPFVEDAVGKLTYTADGHVGDRSSEELIGGSLVHGDLPDRPEAPDDPPSRAARIDRPVGRRSPAARLQAQWPPADALRATDRAGRDDRSPEVAEVGPLTPCPRPARQRKWANTLLLQSRSEHLEPEVDPRPLWTTGGSTVGDCCSSTWLSPTIAALEGGADAHYLAATGRASHDRRRTLRARRRRSGPTGTFTTVGP
jgi:hypothetical protein